jgi:hypothetical protein
VTELFPVTAGLLIGLALGVLRPSWRAPLGAGLAVVLGTLATVLSGEYRISWEFLLIDIPLVAGAAALSYPGARALRLHLRRRPTPP